MTDWIALESQHEFDVVPKRDITVVRGKGAKVWDDKGKEYIDCVGGHGVASIGHANERVANAVSEQARVLITCSGVFYNDVRARFLEKLSSLTPKTLKRAFLCNSGAEAVEAAIKFARFTTKKTDFICAMRNFHGRTMGAISATYNPAYREDFEPLVPGFHHVPYNQFDKLAEKADEKTAAILLEPVQGEGGVNLGQAEYFRKVRSFCDERDILLILDEVQTGFGRTGKWFACEHFGIEPDMLVLAKAMAGGIPIGAVVSSDKIQVPLGKHGSTFGGNPLACAAGIAAIDFMIENRLDEQAREKGRYLLGKLSAIRSPLVREARGIGLMIGIELKEKSKPQLLALMEKGVLALPAGPNVIRLLPPLVIGYDEMDFVAEKIKEVLENS
jgi:LysW-gamma-L-lysine/LysW-L-ornithine aminotransferase